MKYALGLDIGITSVGWAVLDLDRHRVEDLFVRFNLLSPDELDAAFVTSNGKPDPWKLRAEGLDRLLTGEEFARALFHIAKRRGFKSSRKHDTSKEDGKMLASIQENRRRFDERGYRTVGEMMYRDKDFENHKRNKADSYANTVERSMLEHEIRALFDAQRRLGSRHASPGFEAGFLEVFAWQKPFASGDAILKTVGACTFEPDERRAPRACWTAERFVALGKINSLTIIDDGGRRPLTADERQIVEQMAYSLEKVSYKQIRAKLKLPEDARFAQLNYVRRREGVWEEDMGCESAECVKMPGYHAMRKVFEPAGLWDRVRADHDLMDDVAFACTFYKTDEDIRDYLTRSGAEEEVIEAALRLPGFSKVVHLSVKAMRRIIPHLENGMVYSDACTAAGYSHYDPRGEAERGLSLPVIDPDEIRNPVVLRALSQARKVVNAVTRRHGPPTYVHVELAREVGRTAEERLRMTRRIEDNRRVNQEDRERFVENFHREPTGDAMVRWRFYREQNGRCAYSQKPIDLDRLFEPGYAEIDHILPYSRSFDDRMANRVLVLCEENRHKRDRTPHEWFGSDSARWQRFEEWVKANIRDAKKRAALLMRDFDARQADWMQRNLTDTQYIARFFTGYVRRHLRFADPDVRQPVVCLNGFVVSMARGLWGLNKVREENDLHHALDACVVAALTPGRIQMITRYRQAQETGELTRIVDEETGQTWEVMGGRKFSFPEPWKGFRKEVQARLSDDPAAGIAALDLPAYASDPPRLRPVMVSRMPVRKARGAIHAETIRSARELDGKKVSVVRRELVDLKAGDLEKLWDPEHNERLYDAIRERMAQHGNDARKAFAEEFRKPTRSGEPGPIVRSVRVCESQPSGVLVRGGVADNETMVRTDVFTRGGKFYLVPVYVSDLMAGRLPDRAIAAHKPEDEWPVIDSTYRFVFTLRPYDLVRVVAKDEDFTGYYRGTHRGTGALKLTPPNNNTDEHLRSFGARNLVAMEKYHVGVLGDIHRVTGERRVGVANGFDIQPGAAEDRQ